MTDLFAAPQTPRVAVRGGATFPVRRIFCVGRNFADHAREMGAAAPASKSERGQPVFFHKPADALVTGNRDVPYPPGTRDLHHEVELVAAIGRDAPDGTLDRETAATLVVAYGVGLDLTRRDLQAAAKAKGLPWDTGKGFDHSAPISELIPVAQVADLDALTLTLHVNGEQRQRGALSDLIWDVPDILIELSRLYALKAGDLVYMGTPAGVAALQVGDRFEADLGGMVQLSGAIV